MTISNFIVTLHRLGKIAIVSTSIVFISQGQALAFDEESHARVNVDKNQVILENFDPISYQHNGKHGAGSAQFTAIYDDAIYRFKSAKTRDRFLKDPGLYAPAFGGFCAMAASKGHKVDIDPGAYRIRNGRLYVFYDNHAATAWDRDPDVLIAQANSLWLSIRDKAPEDL